LNVLAGEIADALSVTSLTCTTGAGEIWYNGKCTTDRKRFIFFRIMSKDKNPTQLVLDATLANIINKFNTDGKYNKLDNPKLEKLNAVIQLNLCSTNKDAHGALAEVNHDFFYCLLNLFKTFTFAAGNRRIYWNWRSILQRRRWQG